MQLTLSEYQTGYSNALKAFDKSQQKAWEEDIYKVKKGYSVANGILLFLILYALDTWQHSDSAENYITEIEMMALLNKANELG